MGMTHRGADHNMPVKIVSAEKGQAPFTVELMVFEEDTRLGRELRMRYQAGYI